MLKPVQLGERSGLRVSELCLGTMNMGEPGRGHQGDWTLPIDQAKEIFKAAIDHGLFYFDCADVYGIGASEKVVGAILRDLLPRDEYVLATKIAMPMGAGANMGGLSRKHVMEGVDACLQRLGLDYERVRARNPSLIYCSISGFGQNGPMAGRAAYAPKCPVSAAS